MEFTTGSSNVSHVGHLGGVVVGWIYLVYEGKTPHAPTFVTLKRRYQRSRTGKPSKSYRTSRPSKAARPERKLSLKHRYQRQKMRRKLRSVPAEARPEQDQNDDNRNNP